MILDIPQTCKIAEVFPIFSAYFTELPRNKLTSGTLFTKLFLIPLALVNMSRSLLRTATRSIKAAPTSVVGRRYASSAVFNWEDPLAAAELFPEEELAIQDTARQYCQDKLMPRVLGKCFVCFCRDMVF